MQNERKKGRHKMLIQSTGQMVCTSRRRTANALNAINRVSCTPLDPVFRNTLTFVIARVICFLLLLIFFVANFIFYFSFSLFDSIQFLFHTRFKSKLQKTTQITENVRASVCSQLGLNMYFFSLSLSKC